MAFNRMQAILVFKENIHFLLLLATEGTNLQDIFPTFFNHAIHMRTKWNNSVLHYRKNLFAFFYIIKFLFSQQQSRK